MVCLVVFVLDFYILCIIDRVYVRDCIRAEYVCTTTTTTMTTAKRWKGKKYIDSNAKKRHIFTIYVRWPRRLMPIVCKSNVDTFTSLESTRQPNASCQSRFSATDHAISFCVFEFLLSLFSCKLDSQNPVNHLIGYPLNGHGEQWVRHRFSVWRPFVATAQLLSDWWLCQHYWIN